MDTTTLKNYAEEIAKRIEREWLIHKNLTEHATLDNECDIKECEMNIKQLNNALNMLNSVISLVEDL